MDSYLKDLTLSLYERRHLATHVPVRDCSSAQFQPAPKECHVNVDKWCLLNPAHKPVRGWLVIDMTALGHFRFVAHSVVQAEDGHRFDVTPQQSFVKHPFLEDEEMEEVYLLRNSGRNLIFIHHFL
ncbi:MAG: hypothetical protein AAB403_03650 [Planctomycetota bacterium]